MFKLKIFIAALAAASCAYAGPSGNQATSVFITSSAMFVAIVVWSRPPWAFGAALLSAAWCLAAPAALVAVLATLWAGRMLNQEARHRQPLRQPSAQLIELTSSGSTGARGLSKVPCSPRARTGSSGATQSNAGTGCLSREQWFEEIARAANAQPWTVNIITGPAADKFGWRNGPALRSAARALALDETGSVAQVRARVDAWASSVDAPEVVPDDPGEAVIAAACPSVATLLGPRISSASDAEELVQAISEHVQGDQDLTGSTLEQAELWASWHVPRQLDTSTLPEDASPQQCAGPGRYR